MPRVKRPAAEECEEARYTRGCGCGRRCSGTGSGHCDGWTQVSLVPGARAAAGRWASSASTELGAGRRSLARFVVARVLFLRMWPRDAWPKTRRAAQGRQRGAGQKNIVKAPLGGRGQGRDAGPENLRSGGGQALRADPAGGAYALVEMVVITPHEFAITFFPESLDASIRQDYNVTI